MFNKFQHLISTILEIVAAPSPPTSNSTAGGTLGPNATSIDSFKNSSIYADMSITGGTKPKRKKKKNKSFFPVTKRKFPEKIITR